MLTVWLCIQVSMRLNDLPQNKGVPKDYNLRRQNVTSDRSAFTVPNTYVFTEKDLPGYKDRADALFNVNQPHSRSYLYEQTKRDAKKRTNRKKWEPYIRKTIPSMFAIWDDR